MPTYAFRCPDCATDFEERRPFSRATETATCPSCATEGERVFATVLFFSPGTAGRTLLDQEPARPSTKTSGTHAAGCPCCG